MTRRLALSAAALVGFAVLYLGSNDAEFNSNNEPGAGAASMLDVGAAHCDAIADMSVCVEYVSKEEADADCVSFGGTVSTGACPADGLSGSCAHDGKVRKYYKTGGSPQAGDYAEKHCKNAMAGEFTAP